MLNFFVDEITVPGESNLDNLSVQPCQITFGSNAVVSSEDNGYYNVNFRMGIWEPHNSRFFVPKNEIGISLSLKEGEIFCEALYNIAKQNSRTKEPVVINFTGDNKAKAIGAPSAYTRRSEADRRLVPLKITIEPMISPEGVVKITLDSSTEEHFFCSAILGSQNALALSYMVRCSYADAFHGKTYAEFFEERAKT